MIDEYQDTNRSQYELDAAARAQQHRNVCVVGDEDQSIYSWRGADIRNILDFERDFPNAKTIRLEAELSLDEEHSGGGRRGGREQQGAQGQEALDRGRRPASRSASTPLRRGKRGAVYRRHDRRSALAGDPELHVAVLYRTNFQSRQIEEALRRYGRKYIVVGGFSFYQRAEIKDILAYLKRRRFRRRTPLSACYAHHQYAGARHRPHHGRADRAVRARTGISTWDAIGRLIDDRAFPTRAQSALQMLPNHAAGTDARRWHRPLHGGHGFHPRSLRLPEDAGSEETNPEAGNAAGEPGRTDQRRGGSRRARRDRAADFLDHAALVADADGFDSGAQVTLLTMHNAKGLEFPGGLSRRHGRRTCSRTSGRSIPKRQWKRSGGLCYVA